MRHFTILLTISVVLVMGCSHSTAPPASPVAPAVYDITGTVLFLDMESTFDAVTWDNASEKTVNLTGAKTAEATTALSGTFHFDSLPAGNYNVEVILPNYVPASLHVVVPDSINSQNLIYLYPVSWIQPTIDSFKADADPSEGEDIWLHLTSKNLSRPALGTVYFYLSTKDSINPQSASSYDYIYPEVPGSQEKDSVLELRIQPGTSYEKYPSQTRIFCVAYASPYDQQNTVSSSDSTGKIIYPYFGTYPSNAIQFKAP